MAKAQLWKEANEKRIDLVECEMMVDHVHVLVRAHSSMELSGIMKLLKGRSSFEVFQAMPEIKMDAHTNNLWQRGFKSRIVPEDQVATVRQYIRTQDERLEKYER